MAEDAGRKFEHETPDEQVEAEAGWGASDRPTCPQCGEMIWAYLGSGPRPVPDGEASVAPPAAAETGGDVTVQEGVSIGGDATSVTVEEGVKLD